SRNMLAKPYSAVAASGECVYATTFIYDMLPPIAQPIPPNMAKYAARRCQSSRPESTARARQPSEPAIPAPYSCPNCPRIPQPMERESPVRSRNCQLSGLGSRMRVVDAHGEGVCGEKLLQMLLPFLVF